MQYISPLSFLPAGTTATLEPKDLKLAKHKLMAEFELSGATTIKVGEKELTRNDVLKLFDQLNQPEELAYHAVIAASPVLQRFLNEHAIGKDEKFAIPEEKATPEFVEWISPYFAWAFRHGSTRMFRDTKPEEFAALVENPWFMTPDDAWNAWKGVEAYMHNMLGELQTIANARHYSRAQVLKYAGYNIIWLVCNLPGERFPDLLNDYAFAIMELAIKEFNKGQHDSAFELINFAKSLRVSPGMIDSLNAKEEEMRNIKKKNAQVQSRNSIWWVIRIIAFIALVGSRLATCNS